MRKYTNTYASMGPAADNVLSRETESPHEGLHWLSQRSSEGPARCRHLLLGTWTGPYPEQQWHSSAACCPFFQTSSSLPMQEPLVVGHSWFCELLQTAGSKNHTGIEFSSKFTCKQQFNPPNNGSKATLLFSFGHKATWSTKVRRSASVPDLWQACLDMKFSTMLLPIVFSALMCVIFFRRSLRSVFSQALKTLAMLAVSLASKQSCSQAAFLASDESDSKRLFALSKALPSTTAGWAFRWSAHRDMSSTRNSGSLAVRASLISDRKSLSHRWGRSRWKLRHENSNWWQEIVLSTIKSLGDRPCSDREKIWASVRKARQVSPRSCPSEFCPQSLEGKNQDGASFAAEQSLASTFCRTRCWTDHWTIEPWKLCQLVWRQCRGDETAAPRKALASLLSPARLGTKHRWTTLEARPKASVHQECLSRLKAGRVRVSSPPNWSPHNMIIIESKFQCQCIIWFKTIVAWLKAGVKSGHWKWSVCACVFFPFLLAWLRKWIFVQVPLQKWPSSIANPNLARKCNSNFRIIMGGGDGTRDPPWALPRSRISYYGNIKNLFVAGKSKILSSK